MKPTLFNDGWTYRPKVNPFAELSGQHEPYQPVRLPHDAMISRERDPQGEAAGAYFPGGVYQYRKTFHLPAEAPPRAALHFEGVYRDAMVYVNGAFVGQRPNGYAGFTLDLTRHLRWGEDNEVLVEARTHEDSRWYTGAGIYRDVWLWQGQDVHVPVAGLRMSAPDIDAHRAVVEVVAEVANLGRDPRTVDVVAELRGPDGAPVASGTARASVLPGQTVLARQRLYVTDPALWSVDSPALYGCDVQLREAGSEGAGVLDTASSSFGIRRLQLDPQQGLRINGQPVDLRGACVHHDNGVLGAATFPGAERRRVRLLKEAGFNAIRSSHNPLSVAMLEACDQLGMLVVDETFDVWTSGKTGFDYSLNFADWWERDVESMVAKDFNHPSVIMYCIGNEIPETGSVDGGLVGRALAEKVRSLDPTRYTTNAVNGMLAVMKDVVAMMQQRGTQGSTQESAQGADGQDTGINTLMSGPGEMMNRIGSSPLVSEKTAESFSVLDVAGMNYLEARYELDAELFPNRLIIGAETFPPQIDRLWDLVRRNSHVLGDFTWTGWDYLGEVGAGRAQYLGSDGERPSFVASYPWISARVGDLDITGHRRPASYYREIVFGLRDEPFLAVQRPEHYGKQFVGGPWAWSDAVASWTWDGFEAAPVVVEVYSAADEVELLVNGRSAGRAKTGADHRFRCAFDTKYEPGELVAVAYRGGAETARTTLRSATGPVQLNASCAQEVLQVERDVAFVELSLTDERGTVHTGTDREITLTVRGPGVLLGHGSADPVSEAAFSSPRQRTFEGRSLAVVAATGEGEVVVSASAPGCEPVEVVLRGAAQS